MNVPLSKPIIGEADIAAVTEVLRSGWLIHGAKNEELEQALAKYIETKFAVTLNSCASALQIALAVKGIGKGDKVLLPAFTHSATANAVMAVGATPVFVDADTRNFNMDLDDLEHKIVDNPKAVIVVHYAGSCCDMDRLIKIIGDYDLALIEDTAEACGTSFRGRRLGSFGVGCFSFFPTKNMTTGEGGALTTNSDTEYSDACCMISHGMEKKTWASADPQAGWQRLQRTAGYNFRLTNFQAALGVEQLKKLDAMNEERKRIARLYLSRFRETECIKPQEIVFGCNPTYQMFTMRVVGLDRNTFVRKLKEKGIGAGVHFDPPVHRQPFYYKLYGEQNLPKTEMLSRTICTLPLYPYMQGEDIEAVIAAVMEAVKEMKVSQ